MEIQSLQAVSPPVYSLLGASKIFDVEKDEIRRTSINSKSVLSRSGLFGLTVFIIIIILFEKQNYTFKTVNYLLSHVRQRHATFISGYESKNQDVPFIPNSILELIWRVGNARFLASCSEGFPEFLNLWKNFSKGQVLLAWPLSVFPPGPFHALLLLYVSPRMILGVVSSASFKCSLTRAWTSLFVRQMYVLKHLLDFIRYIRFSLYCFWSFSVVNWHLSIYSLLEPTTLCHF